MSDMHVVMMVFGAIPIYILIAGVSCRIFKMRGWDDDDASIAAAFWIIVLTAGALLWLMQAVWQLGFIIPDLLMRRATLLAGARVVRRNRG